MKSKKKSEAAWSANGVEAVGEAEAGATVAGEAEVGATVAGEEADGVTVDGEAEAGAVAEADGDGAVENTSDWRIRRILSVFDSDSD